MLSAYTSVSVSVCLAIASYTQNKCLADTECCLPVLPGAPPKFTLPALDPNINAAGRFQDCPLYSTTQSVYPTCGSPTLSPW